MADTWLLVAVVVVHCLHLGHRESFFSTTGLSVARNVMIRHHHRRLVARGSSFLFGGGASAAADVEKFRPQSFAAAATTIVTGRTRQRRRQRRALSSSFASSSTSWDDALSDESRALANQLLNVNHEKKNSATSSTDDDGRPCWKSRIALSKAITLAESRNPRKQHQAAMLLTHLLRDPVAQERRKRGFRLGVAGSPGAGKSTFIEALGNYVLELSSESESKSETAAELDNSDTPKSDNDKNNSTKIWAPRRVAVVCVDPSGKHGGSVLGDKTRMAELSRHPRAYVRPAPAAGALGGIASYTDDVATLCQVADYELVVVETVGLGQSEIEIEQAVDLLLLLVPPAGGDDLQGAKKGIVEVADLLIVTKADGDLLRAAKRTAADYKGAMQFLHSMGRPTTPLLKGWERPDVMLVSSVTKQGLDDVWRKVSQYRQQAAETGVLETKRISQRRYWMWKNLRNLVELETQQNPALQEKARGLERDLIEGRMAPRVAASELLQCLRQHEQTTAPKSHKDDDDDGGGREGE